MQEFIYYLARMALVTLEPQHTVCKTACGCCPSTQGSWNSEKCNKNVQREAIMKRQPSVEGGALHGATYIHPFLLHKGKVWKSVGSLSWACYLKMGACYLLEFLFNIFCTRSICPSHQLHAAFVPAHPFFCVCMCMRKGMSRFFSLL